jgi:hypothetical protein
MIENTPVVSVERNKTGSIRLGHFAVERSTGRTLAWGTPTLLSAEEFSERGLDAVLQSLMEFPLRDGDDVQQRYRVPQEEQTRLAREWLSLKVKQVEPNTLIILPTRRERGGYVGKREEQAMVHLPCASESFVSKINVAFDKCS